jgi:hypothetical protein
VEWTHLVQDWDRSRVLVNTVFVGLHKLLGDYWLHKQDSDPRNMYIPFYI